jgi:hypothetical protein
MAQGPAGLAWAGGDRLSIEQVVEAHLRALDSRIAGFVQPHGRRLFGHVLMTRTGLRKAGFRCEDIAALTPRQEYQHPIRHPWIWLYEVPSPTVQRSPRTRLSLKDCRAAPMSHSSSGSTLQSLRQLICDNT